MAQGTLLITLLNADLKHDTELLGKMDPYVQLELGNQLIESSTKYSAGKHPIWKETFCFRCQEGQRLSFQVMDEEKCSKADLIMSGWLDVRNNQGRKEKLQLNGIYKEKAAGSLNIQYTFMEDGVQYHMDKKEQQRREQINEDRLYQRIKNDPVLMNIKQRIEEAKMEKEGLQQAVASLCQVRQEAHDKAAAELKKVHEYEESMASTKMKLQVLTDKIESIKTKGNRGILQINGIFLTMLNGGSVFDKLDPYVVIQVGDKTTALPARVDSGKKAQWAGPYELEAMDAHEIMFTVMEENIGADDILGMCSVSLYDLDKEQEIVRQVFQGNTVMGSIKFELKYMESQ